MWDILFARLRQKHRTTPFPDGPPPRLPERFAGRPHIAKGNCPAGCERCTAVCPTGALRRAARLQLDLGACLFCRECVSACEPNNIRFSRDYRMATSRRADLRQNVMTLLPPPSSQGAASKHLFSRSLKLRQVSAGGCNACEADTNVLGTVGWDLGRFGIQFVASPRHADGVLVTGPVTENMRTALQKTYEAVPSPKLVIAVGACAISGGPYAGHVEVHDGVEGLLPVDLFIPGCPPHPLTILDGLLRLIGRIAEPPERLADRA